MFLRQVLSLVPLFCDMFSPPSGVLRFVCTVNQFVKAKRTLAVYIFELRHIFPSCVSSSLEIIYVLYGVARYWCGLQVVARLKVVTKKGICPANFDCAESCVSLQRKYRNDRCSAARVQSARIGASSRTCCNISEGQKREDYHQSVTLGIETRIALKTFSSWSI